MVTYVFKCKNFSMLKLIEKFFKIKVNKHKT